MLTYIACEKYNRVFNKGEEELFIDPLNYNVLIYRMLYLKLMLTKMLLKALMTLFSESLNSSSLILLVVCVCRRFVVVMIAPLLSYN